MSNTNRINLAALHTAMMAPFFGADISLPSTRGAKWEFTLHNTITNNHLTLKSFRPKGWAVNSPVLISVLEGEEWSFIGSVGQDNIFRTSKKVGVVEVGSRKDKAIKTMAWLTNLTTQPANLDIFTAGCCCRCGRKITNPDSLNAHIGPECRNRMNTSTPAGRATK